MPVTKSEVSNVQQRLEELCKKAFADGYRAGYKSGFENGVKAAVKFDV